MNSTKMEARKHMARTDVALSRQGSPRQPARLLGLRRSHVPTRFFCTGEFKDFGELVRDTRVYAGRVWLDTGGQKTLSFFGDFIYFILNIAPYTEPWREAADGADAGLIRGFSRAVERLSPPGGQSMATQKAPCTPPFSSRRHCCVGTS